MHALDSRDIPFPFRLWICIAMLTTCVLLHRLPQCLTSIQRQLRERLKSTDNNIFLFAHIFFLCVYTCLFACMLWVIRGMNSFSNWYLYYSQFFEQNFLLFKHGQLLHTHAHADTHTVIHTCCETHIVSHTCCLTHTYTLSHTHAVSTHLHAHTCAPALPHQNHCSEINWRLVCVFACIESEGEKKVQRTKETTDKVFIWQSWGGGEKMKNRERYQM